jgi:hypothetical protein
MTETKPAKKPRKTGKKSRGKKRREGERATVKSALIGTVTAAELSEILGLTDERLRQLAKEGMPKASRGRYPLRDAVRFYADSLRKRRETGDDGPSKTDMERDLLAIKLKKAQGEVFDRGEVFDTLRAAYERLGGSLETLATRIGRELNLAGEDVKMVRELVDEMRARYVQDCGEFIDVVEDVQPSQTAAA